MERYPSHEVQFQLYNEYRAYLSRFPWEWHATLTLEDGVNFFKATKLFHRWRMRMVDEEKMRIAAYVVSAYKKRHIHFHALMLGRNRGGQCLRNCDPRRWEDAWPYFARIRPVTSNSGVCQYVASHFLGFKSGHTEIAYYDRTLLRQVMTPPPQYEGMDGLDGFLPR